MFEGYECQNWYGKEQTDAIEHILERPQHTSYCENSTTAMPQLLMYGYQS